MIGKERILFWTLKGEGSDTQAVDGMELEVGMGIGIPSWDLSGQHSKKPGEGKKS